VGSAWQRINSAIRRALDDVTLQQLAGLDSAASRASALSLDIRNTLDFHRVK
jgi:DNA-binding IscR family transcriptional regulator